MPCWHIRMLMMEAIPTLVTKLLETHGGNAEKAANALGTSPASLSRWRSGQSRPGKNFESRLRAMVENSDDLFSTGQRSANNARLERLESAISGTVHALREE